jgi:hypothetical protein
MAETGTSVGEISGQSKPINSCDFRPSRPFRIITGSEDNTIGVFEGPPFKFKMTKQVITLILNITYFKQFWERYLGGYIMQIFINTDLYIHKGWLGYLQY